jgi:hypothetical protein
MEQHTRFLILALIIGLSVAYPFNDWNSSTTKSPSSLSYGLYPDSSSKPSYANVVSGVSPSRSPSASLLPTSQKPVATKSSQKPLVSPPTPSPTQEPAVPTNITFVIAARDLPVKKKGAKVDPYVKVFHKTATLQETKDWLPVGQSETLKENNSPDFTSVFTYEWTRGKNQV